MGLQQGNENFQLRKSWNKRVSFQFMSLEGCVVPTLKRGLFFGLENGFG